MKKMKKGLIYRKTEEKAGLLDKKERRVERKLEKTGGKMMGWLAWICLIAFIGYVANAGYRVATGSVDWMDTDDDDDTSMWDDDWMGNDDMLTSPVYSWMSCNIWHDPFEDDFNWSSSDDDWMWDNNDD